jgi:hypothetical protein
MDVGDESMKDAGAVRGSSQHTSDTRRGIPETTKGTSGVRLV